MPFQPSEPAPKLTPRRVLIFLCVAAAGFLLALRLDGPVYDLYRSDRFHMRQDYRQLLNFFGFYAVWLVGALGYLLVDTADFKRMGLGGVLNRACLFVFSVVLAGGAGEVLKVVIRRERPLDHGTYLFRPWGQNWDDGTGLGLPSTHACTAFAGAWSLTFLHPRGAPVWLGLALGCGAARIQSQAHFLSDVYLGAVVAFVAVYLVYRPRRPRPPPGGSASVSSDAMAGGQSLRDEPALASAAREQSTPLAWMTWPATVLLTLGVLAVRVLYLVKLCPYELLGDEALYWEWSRRLTLCYSDKGPGIAYLIALGTAVFGTSEWAVRLPMAVASAVATLALARLATACSRGDQRVGFFAAMAFTLMPAYQVNAQICTQDGPLIAAWILGAWAAWHLFSRLQQGHAGAGPWLLLGAVIGVGFLFKQSMLLLVPGLVLFAALQWRTVPWSLRLARNAGVAIVVFTIIISPMVIWNWAHGWPTLARTLGYLGAPGGDQVRDAGVGRPGYNPQWTLILLGAQIGAFGPPAILAMILAIAWAIRTRREQPDLWPPRLLMICCAGPSLVLYLAITFWKKAEGNWPFPSFGTLLVLVAQLAVIELPRRRRMLRAWWQDPRRPRPWQGFLRRRPETLFQISWHSVVIYGLVAWLIVCFPNIITSSRWLGHYVPKERFTGHRASAARVADLLRQVEAEAGQPPFVAASHYMRAALTAFYLPDHPTVYDARSLMSRRTSPYDFWEDTDLSSGALLGRPAILLGGDPQRWQQAMRFDRLELRDEALPAYLGVGYRGPHSR